MLGADLGYTSFQRTAVVVSAVVAYGLDFYNLLILPFVLPSIQKVFHVSLVAAGLMASIQLFTSVVGGLLFGWIGDRIGRRTTMVVTMLLFGLGALLSAVSWNFGSLLVFRAITGLGLGGEWGVGMVLLNEVWPPSRRGLGSCIIESASPAFSILAAAVATAFLASAGAGAWRLVLLTGAFPILLAPVILFVMPESHVWQEYARLKRAGQLPAEKQHAPAPLLAMLRGRGLYLAAIGTLIVAGYMFAYEGFNTYLPLLLATRYHAPRPAIGGMIEVGSAVAVAACIVIGLIGDRWGRRIGFLLPTIVSVIGSFGFVLAGRAESAVYAGSFWVWSLLWWYIIWHIGQSGLGMMGAWLSELFPVEMRSTAVSAIYMVGRAASAAGPPVVALVAAANNGDVLLGMAVAFGGVLVQLVLLFLLPTTRAVAFTVISNVGDAADAVIG